MLAVDAANEQAHQQLLFCTWSLGDRSAALKQFDECKRALHDELGVEPSPDTLALYKRIKQAGIAGSSPATAATNLPIPLTSFIGREREMSTVKQVLGATRLLTLTGVGGCGKTRLAIQVAREMVDQFADGAWWVELAAAREDERVLQLVMKALGIIEAGQLSPLDTLLNYLQMRRVLLVIDNCEHLVKACADLAETILSRCPHMRILATSRETLNISGEIAWLVPSLSLPSDNDLSTPSRLLQSESVRLFVERATVMRGDFVLTPANAPAVVHICQRLDGIPLAIELAAARMKALTVEQIEARLDDRFGLLTTGSRTALPRHQTLRATIDWSYELLSASEQALCRRLAVFVGGCTLEAIEAICRPEADSHEAIIETIAALMSKSLLNRVDGANNQSRYSMLEMIREYALEKLVESGEADQWRLFHAQYYLALAQAVVGLNYFSEAEAIEHLQPELDNLRAAITWSLATPDHAEIGLGLIPAMSACALIRGGLDAEWNQLRHILAQSHTAKCTLAWTDALAAVATSLGVLGDFATAYELMEESLSVSRELKDEAHSADFLCELGRLARERGDMPAAQVRLEEGVALYRKLGDSQGLAGGLTTLGEVAVMQEDVALASDSLTESLALSEKYDHMGSAAWSLNHLGHVAQLEGDYARAIALHEHSLPLLRRIGQLMGPAHTLESLGEIALSQGDAARATAHLVESLALFRKLGDRMGIAWCLADFAGVAALTEEPARAARLWGASEGLRQKIGCRTAPASRKNRERTVARLREQWGEAEFERLTVEGRKMTLEQAIEEAMGV